MPSRVFTRLRAAPVAALAGAVVGVMLSPGGGLDWAWGAYDRAFPVVEMQGVIAKRDDQSVTVHIGGKKNRSCQYLTIRAYANIGGALVDINTERADRPEDKHTKPVGVFSIGYWRAWPVASATSVQWHVSHSCDGRLVVTKVAEAVL